MSDLFHERVPVAFIRRVFQVMNQCAQHSFQVLTKRPERAAEICAELEWTPNIWIGVSIENSEVVNRIEPLKKISANIRFLSIEPLLGPLPILPLDGIHWVIVGGESGPGARPIEEKWVTRIRDHCVNAGVPFFFKQWGGPNKKSTGRRLEGALWNETPKREAVEYA